MTENRFAKVKQTFQSTPKRGKTSSSKKQNQEIRKSPESYNKKQRFPFSLHYNVRYDMLDSLVEYHGEKSASSYIENLIIREWEKMQRKIKQ